MTLAEGILLWLKGEAVLAGIAKIPATVIILKGAAIAGTTVASNWVGGWVYSKIRGTPQDSENIKRRVVAMSALGLGTSNQEFTNEVHMEETFGWTLDGNTKEILAYKPFSSEMVTIGGDPGSLDNNRLPSVEFIASPSVTNDNWRYWPDPEHCPEQFSGESQYQRIDISENMHAECTYSSVGTLSVEDIFSNGKRLGWYKTYFYFDGQLRLTLQRPYSNNGKANGLASEYHLSNGALRLQYTFLDDALNGEYKQFTEQGTLVQCDIYESDERVGSCMP